MATEGPDHDMVVLEIRAIDRRISLITRAIRLLVVGGLAIGMTVATLFLEELVTLNLQLIAAGFFLVAVALLMWALVLFLSEIQIAAAQLRIPLDYLELEREL